MIKFIMMIILSAVSITAQEITWTDVTSTHEPLPDGISIFMGVRESPKLQIFYIDADMNNQKLAVRPYITGSPSTVPQLNSRFGAYASINGGFFGGSVSYSAVVYPNEVKAQNVPVLTRNSISYPVVRGFFGMNNEGDFSVDYIYHYGAGIGSLYKFEKPLPYGSNDPTPLPAPDSSAGAQYSELLLGIGGAPVLVKDGVINITYNEEIMWGSGVGLDNRDPRSAVGYTADNHVIMIAADGRSINSEGVSLPELAQIFLDLGCVEALNLDGGGSTQMAAGGKFVNNIQTRAVPSILSVVHKDSLNLPKVPVIEKILDTGDEGVYLYGPGWFSSANAGYYGSTQAQLNPVGDGSSYAEYKLNLPAAGSYEIYAWWVASANRTADTPFILNHEDGVDTVSMDQTGSGSTWNLIGTYNFNGDTTEAVIISNKASGGMYIVADGIRAVSYDTSGVTAVEHSSNLPVEFSLEQNYPNPFNPETVISFNLAEAGEVNLIIYDMLGRQAAAPLSSYLSAGRHSFRFNADEYGLSSGVYLYKLSQNNSIASGKMMFLK